MEGHQLRQAKVEPAGDGVIRVRHLTPGERIEPGDIFRVVHRIYGKRGHRITRVTKHFAFYRQNDVSEGKLRRELDHFGPRVVPSPKWDTQTYEILRPVPEIPDAATPNSFKREG